MAAALREYTPTEAAAVSEIGIKSVHNAIDKRIIRTPVGNMLLFTEVPPSINLLGPSLVNGISIQDAPTLTILMQMAGNTIMLSQGGIVLQAGPNSIVLSPAGINIISNGTLLIQGSPVNINPLG